MGRVARRPRRQGTGRFTANSWAGDATQQLDATQHRMPLDSMIAAALVAMVPRLDCRYQSLSRQPGNCVVSRLSSRYRTALSAIVALTSTPTRTKQPQAADLVPHFTTTYELLRSRLRLQVQYRDTISTRRKTMVPHLHSVLRVPDLHAGAGAGQRHHAPGQTFHQAHILVPKQPACQNTPSARWALQAAMQAPGRKRMSCCLGKRRHHTCALSLSAYARCSLQARRMPCLCSLPRIPRQT